MAQRYGYDRSPPHRAAPSTEAEALKELSAKVKVLYVPVPLQIVVAVEEHGEDELRVVASLNSSDIVLRVVACLVA
jgi:hypothetical protein